MFGNLEMYQISRNSKLNACAVVIELLLLFANLLYTKANIECVDTSECSEDVYGQGGCCLLETETTSNGEIVTR